MGLFSWLKSQDGPKPEENVKSQNGLEEGLQKTKRSLFEKLSYAVAGKSTIDDDVLDSIEEALIASDMGVETTQKVIERLEARVARDKYLNPDEVDTYLCEEIEQMLEAASDGRTDDPYES